MTSTFLFAGACCLLLIALSIAMFWAKQSYTEYNNTHPDDGWDDDGSF